ncbi:class I SAM-dependent methyltransferase [Deferribacterales bacterium RsTz2092]
MVTTYKRNIKNSTSISDIQLEAQRLVFAPLIFQMLDALLHFNILMLIATRGDATAQVICERTELSEYAVSVLLELAQNNDIVLKEGDKYSLTELGKYLLNNQNVLTNIKFVHDVCYKGSFYLKESLVQMKACGLHTFGGADMSDGINGLPHDARQSLIDFNSIFHYVEFSELLSMVLKRKPAVVYVISSGNERLGKSLLAADENVKLVCLGTAEQMEASKFAMGSNVRISYVKNDVLTDDVPAGADILILDMLLSTLDEQQAVHVLRKASMSVRQGGAVYILEPLVDEQSAVANSLALSAISIYCATLGNGASKMFNKNELLNIIEKAGLRTSATGTDKGSYDYTLFECVVMGV